MYTPINSRLLGLIIVMSWLTMPNILAQNEGQMDEIIKNVSKARLTKDVTTLVNFGTRHTLSDTISNVRGIGAARRYIKSEFEKISSDCGGCLDVFYQRTLVSKGSNERIFSDVWVVNVIAIQRGQSTPNDYVIMSGDIDSRISDPNNHIDVAPGANDNAQGWQVPWKQPGF